MFPNGEAPKAEEDDKPAFYIHNKPEGFCGLCNVPGYDHVMPTGSFLYETDVFSLYFWEQKSLQR